MVCRLIVLRHSEHPDEQEKGFVGNTILLTQPRPEEIIRTLPPPEDEASKYLSVCFNSQKMTTADVGKHHALKVNSEEYIRCARLRQKVNPVFAEIHLDEHQVRTQFPHDAVPSAILQGAQPMDTLDTFNPTLDGPATMKAATCNLPPENMEDCDNETTDAASSMTHNADPPADSSTLLADPPAELSIGIQDDDAHEPVDLMIVIQKNLELVQEAGKNLHKLEQRRRCSTDADTKTEAASALAAEKNKLGTALVDLRKLASKMGRDYQQQMEEALVNVFLC